MPTIIVRSDATDERDRTVTLTESVQPAHLASGHHAAQLIQRLGWAVNDAKDAEHQSDLTNPGHQPKEIQ